MRKFKKSLISWMSKALSLLMSFVLILSMIPTAHAAESARVTYMEYQSHPYISGINGNAVIELRYEDGTTGSGICADPEPDAPPSGTALSLSSANTTLTKMAYLASQTSNETKLFGLHHAAAKALGLGNGSAWPIIAQMEAEAAAVTVPSNFEAFVATPSNNYQTCLVWRIKPTGNVTLAKSSANPALTDGNSCYSLAGAVYGIYGSEADAKSDRSRLGTLTTGANGKSGTLELNVGNYFYRELTAPKGYALDSKIYSFTISSGQTTTLNASDRPQSDPVGILLKKQGGAGEALADGEFTIRYYDGQYATAAAAEASGNPTRTWVFKTDSDGYVDLRVPSKYFVSGDELYRSDSGRVTIPMGTLLIQETKAPYGYIIDNTVHVINITPEGSSSDTVESYNSPTLTNQPVRKPLKVVKFSEDGKVSGVKFHVTGGPENIDVNVTTGEDGSITIPNLRVGTYSVTEESVNFYEPQETKRVEILPDASDPAVITFTNTLKRGSLQVTKTSEDGLVEGVTFRLTGTALNGSALDLTAKTDASGVATFKDVLISDSDYTIEEVDTGIRYVVPSNQTAVVNWNEVTKIDFKNVLKKFNVSLVKKDAETGTAQAGLSLEGAVYGIYKDGELLDEYTTDKNGKFTTDYYTCGSDYVLKEITPPTGYLLDKTEHALTADADNFTVEKNTLTVTSNEQVIKGRISIVKHSDKNDSIIEKPEKGAQFQIYLKSAGSYDAAKDTERDLLTTDRKGCAESKGLPYGTYVVHQSKGLVSSHLAPDFEVEITENGEKYFYLINNVPIEAYLRVQKVDAFDNQPITTGAKFQIRNPDGSLYKDPITGEDTFRSDSKGYIKTSNSLPYGEGYKLVEIQAPNGYYISRELKDGVSFDVKPGSYILDKLNAGSSAKVAIVEFTASNDSAPTISTVAAAADRSKVVVQGTQAIVKDSVILSNVIYGKDYTVNGVLVDKATGLAVTDANGNRITATAKVIPAFNNTARVDLTYTFDTTLLGGKELVSCVELVRTYGIKSEVVAQEKDLNNADQTVTVPTPSIGTTATVDGKKLADPLASVELVDTIFYENLTPGTQYTFRGTVMDKATGKALLDKSGNPVTVSAAHTPKRANGTTEVKFTLDTRELCGKELVVFEEVYAGEHFIVAHKELDDKEQTIRVTNPEISTTANVGGEHVALAGEQVEFVDVVNYKDLIPGKEYTMNGQLMLQETGDALMDKAGNAILSSAKFTPETANGSVKLSFKFDGSLVTGKSVVAFEDLQYKQESISVHADLSDEGQTVHFPEIGTTMTAADGNKVTDPLSSVELVDAVSYTNLIPGQEYTVKGTLMVKDTGKNLLDADGNPVSATTKFTPVESKGTVDLHFTINASELHGQSIVAFESVQYKGKDVATHKDMNDEGQTVKVNNPQIGTIATVDGEHIAFAADSVTLTDVVTYDGVTPGKEYTVNGVLMIKETGKPLLDKDGNAVSATSTFTAEETAGKTTVTFTFDASRLAGQSIVAFEDLLFGTDLIASHKDIDDAGQTVHIPKISTTLTDVSGNKSIDPMDKIELVDRVSYENLIPGKTYTVNGCLMLASTGEALLNADGKAVTATVEFTPDNSSGTLELKFIVDAAELRGQNIVAFEEVALDGSVVATHTDLKDEDQTVAVNVPSIKTEATVNGSHQFIARKGVTLIDEVSYSNLTAGKEYTVTGKLMDKSTGKALLNSDGKEITSNATFTAKDSNGRLKVKFHFDASDLGGKTLVVFEDLYCNDTKLASHADLNDAAQSVFVEIVPATGDNSNIAVYAIVCAFSAAALIGITICFKRRKSFK